ncbi:MAG: hypothetical protein VKK97_02705 [Synechococcaceae cyanobacterium]|nr:hypothetical protein [Synechococcaceae cyanobacterium]
MEMEAEPLMFLEAVNRAVRVRPEPLTAERVPPETEISPELPFQEKEEPGSSEKEKVMVAVSPAIRDVLSLLIDREGGRVSKLSDGERAAEPGLPKESV